jgi:hypothetical protein
MNLGELILKPRIDMEVIRFDFTGSQVIGGATSDSDFDILVQVKEIHPTENYNTGGYEWHAVDYGMVGEDINFQSLKHESVNLILTNKTEFYDLFMLATKTARMLNLTKKEDRIRLFQFILYGVTGN